MLFRKFSTGNVEHYTGRSSYKIVERMMRSSKELMVISPFVDQHYAEFLRDISANKKILLLSSSIDKAAAKALRRKSRPFTFLLISLILVMLNFSEFYVHIISIPMILATIFLIFVFAVFLLRGSSNVYLRHPKGFVHMKLYLSESEAIQSSANLTYSGMHSNVEHIEVFHDPETVRLFNKDFMKLWHDST